MGRLAELIAQGDLSDNERDELKNLVEQLEGLLATVDIVDSSGQTTFQGPTKHYREAVFHTNAFDTNSRKRGIRMFNPANSDIVGFIGMRNNAYGDLILGVDNLSQNRDTSIAFTDSSTGEGQIVLRVADVAIADFKTDGSGNNRLVLYDGAAGLTVFLGTNSDHIIDAGKSGVVHFNNNSLNIDFKINGDTVTDVFKVDAGKDVAYLRGIGARAYNDAAISIPDAAGTLLTFNSERYDTDAIHSVSSNTGRLTCKTAGVYQVSVSAEFAANATGVRRCRIRRDGTTFIAGYLSNAASAGTTIIAFSTTWKFAVDEYVEVFAYQTSGGDLNMNSTADYSPEFMMVKVA